MKNKKHVLLFIIILLVISNFNISYSQELHGSILAPVYDGGFKALKEFINRNNNYYDESNRDLVSGVVTVCYTINGNSRVENIKILRGLNAVYDSEAIRITQLISGWHGAVQWGKPVSVKIVMPIEFYIEDENKKGQTVIVKGNICNKVTGGPIEGTLVLAKGTNIGAVTDKNGNYNIELPGDEFELEYSSIGYGREYEKIGRNRIINVELLPEDLIIDFSSDEI